MAKDVDLGLLRQVTADSIHVFEALGRGEVLSAEGKRAVTMAEDLLHYAGLTYLIKDIDTGVNEAIDSSRAPQEMISAYVQIQQCYADLKDALYRLAKNCLEAKQWDDACAVMKALLKIDPQYRDTAMLLGQNLLAQAEDLFKQGKWEEEFAVLRQVFPVRKERIEYFLGVLLRHDITLLDVDDVLRSLQIEEPLIRSSGNFAKALYCARDWKEEQYPGQKAMLKKAITHWLDAFLVEDIEKLS